MIAVGTGRRLTPTDGIKVTQNQRAANPSTEVRHAAQSVRVTSTASPMAANHQSIGGGHCTGTMT